MSDDKNTSSLIDTAKNFLESFYNDISDEKTTSSPIDTAKNFLESLIEKLKTAQNKKFTFLLVGRTGVGKSSTVNSLMGKPVAKVGDYEPTTMGIESYESELNGIQFTVYDTPGLCDDIEEEGNDEKYLRSMRSKVTQIDSMWFVSRLDETRVTADEKRGIKLISEAFTAKVWEHAVIIFTFANSVEKERYQEALDTRTKLIKKEIAKYTSAEVADKIPSIAVDNKSKTTPDGEWLGELYTKVLLRISERGILPFLMATGESIRPNTVYRFGRSSDNIRRDTVYPSGKSSADASRGSKEEYSSKYPSGKSSADASRGSNGEYSSKYQSGKSSADASRASKGEYSSNEKRQEPRIKLNDQQKKAVKNKIIDAGIIPSLALVGAGVGATFGPLGVIIGGGVGAALGLFAWLWD